ncbi:NADPH:quinone oxidoreductase family protein [Paracoccus luteus]|uniref:NADPH:quinone oxidoreductase family protein n=1 Tax=Paracoccus luteus TaxID=2508543 RepID=UPI0010705E9E|nr:NADPH:quinone oxidoreductase family protein [Paracoccus luteus]
MSRIIQIARQGAAPELGRRAPPEPGPGQVRLRLHAAALNFADLLMIEGRYQDAPPFPLVAGIEGAGVVEAAGEGVALTPGTRVAVTGPGTLADHGVFAADLCIAVPDRMSLAQAAGFQIAYGTSHLALTGPGALAAGQRVVVLGAAGGVGLTAVEIASVLGAEVVAVVRGEDKAAPARQAGAAVVIDSAAEPDLRAALRAHGPADIVYDPVGDAAGLAAFGALRTGGRHLLIGFAGGKPPALPLNHALVKNIAIHGFYWGGYRQLDPAALRASLTALFALFDQGRLNPTLGTVLPLDRAAEGYALLRDRRAVGKVVITMTE